MVKSTEATLTAHDVEMAVRAHFPQPRYAVITGVRNAAGWDARRTCDALAIGVWQSTANDLHGFEIKVSRSDWQREMQDPLKAEAFAAHCDYWWIAASPGIVKIEELPVAWGLMEVAGKGLRVRKPASKRESPLPVDRELLACFARRVCEQSPAEAIIEAAEKRGREQAHSAYAAREKKREPALYDFEGKQAVEALARFKAATGVDLGSWNADKVAASFKRFYEVEQVIGTEARYGTLLAALKNVKEKAEEGIAALATPPPLPARGGGQA